MSEWLGLVLVAVVAALPGLYATMQQRKKLDAEATAQIAQAALGLLDDLREENTRLREGREDAEIEKQVLHETLMSYVGRVRMLEADLALEKRMVDG